MISKRKVLHYCVVSENSCRLTFSLRTIDFQLQNADECPLQRQLCEHFGRVPLISDTGSPLNANACPLQMQI